MSFEDLDDLFVVEFHSYSGHGNHTAFFRTMERANAVFDDATAVLESFTAAENETPVCPITVEDDFGFRSTFNLINYRVVVANIDGQCALSALHRRITEDAKCRHDNAKPVGVHYA